MIGIIGAMEIEVAGLISEGKNISCKTVSGIDFTSCTIGKTEVVIAMAGIGKVNAALCTEAMILTFAPDLIINTGVAGSLSSDLNIGDVVIADSICQHDFNTTQLGDELGLLPRVNLVKVPTDKNASEQIAKIIEANGINYKFGTVASGDQFISSQDAKNYIIDNFQASACEMEGGSIGHVCYLNKTPFVVLRAMSDSANEGACDDFPAFCELASKNSIKILLEFLK